MGPKCNVAPALKILGVPRLPPGGSLGTGKRGTMPKIWRAVPIFLARLNGVKMISRNKMFRHVFHDEAHPSPLPPPSPL